MHFQVARDHKFRQLTKNETLVVRERIFYSKSKQKLSEKSDIFY